MNWLEKKVPYFLRLGLGLVFLILGFMKVRNYEAMWPVFADASNNFVDPFFQQLIPSMPLFVKYLGWVEFIVGIAILVGLFTRIFAIIAGLMLWSFVAANGSAGEISLSMNLAFMGFAFALAHTGPGYYSWDQLFFKERLKLVYRRSMASIILRLSFAYVFITSSLFINFHNQFPSLPIYLTWPFGALLLIGLLTRVTSVAVAISMIVSMFSIGINSNALPYFALFLASIALAFLGAGHWSLDKKLKKAW